MINNKAKMNLDVDFSSTKFANIFIKIEEDKLQIDNKNVKAQSKRIFL